MASSLLLTMLVGCGAPLVFVDPLVDSGVGDDTAADTADTTSPDDSGVPDGDGDGWVGSADCDDADAAVFPGAAETCGNGVDDDCDGRADGCGFDGLVLAEEDAVATVGDDGPFLVMDLDDDGVTDLVGFEEGLLLWSGPLAGAPEAHEWPDLDLSSGVAFGEGIAGVAVSTVVLLPDPLGDADGAWITVSGGQRTRVVAAGDDALLLGNPGWPDDTDRSGGAWLHRGPFPTDRDGVADAAAVFVAERRGDRVGEALARVGDVDGDGVEELAIGAAGEGSGGDHAGAVYLVSADVTDTLALADAPWKLVSSGTAADADLTLAAAGDADGDGLADLLVGAPLADDVAVDEVGRVDLWVRGEVTTRWWGAQEHGWLGYDIEVVDLDGDGVADLAMSEPGADLLTTHGGAFRVWRGPWTAGAPDATVAAALSSTDLGGSMASGDLDADGIGDLVMGGYVLAGGLGF